MKWFIDCQFVKCSLGVSEHRIVGLETYFIVFSVKMEITCTIYHLLARMVEITEGDLDSPPWGCPYNESRLNSCGLQGASVSSTVFFSLIVVFIYVRVHLYVCIHHLYMYTVFGLRPAPQSPAKKDRDKDREFPSQPVPTCLVSPPCFVTPCLPLLLVSYEFIQTSLCTCKQTMDIDLWFFAFDT